jgi:patatin-like phospholipase/acyl hydrolase
MGKYYNVLTIDGGGIRGLIPARILQKIESYAYNYSSSMNYTFPIYSERPGVIAMKDLFDMAAGTSTGSIITAALAYPEGDFGAEA